MEISKVKNLVLNKSFWHLECRCDRTGSEGLNCYGYGYCTCKAGYSGQKCSECAGGYFQSNERCNGKIKLHLYFILF